MSLWTRWGTSFLALALFSAVRCAPAANSGPMPRVSRRRHQRKAAWPVFNIKDYGAKCDGRTDDSTSIQAAIRAANENGIVYIPAGTCVFSAPILAGKVQVRGVGKNVSILKYVGVGGSAFTFDYPVPMFMLSPGMSDLSLIGPGPETNTTGLMLGGKSGAEGSQFQFLEVSGFGTGVRSSSWAFLTEFRDCYFSDATDLLLIGSPSSGENMRFVHCTFDHTTKPSSVIVGGGDFMQPEFVDCSFDGAILRIHSGMVSLVGGHFEDTVGGGKYFAIIGDGRHDATASFVNVTLTADGKYSYPDKSLFYVKAAGNLSVQNLQACTLIPAFNVMNVDAGGRGFILNLMVPNCGGWPATPLAATGKGSAAVAQVAAPGAGAGPNNVFTEPLQFGKDGPVVRWGSGVPGGSCVTSSLYLNKTGRPGSTLYVCVAGRWAAIK